MADGYFKVNDKAKPGIQVPSIVVDVYLGSNILTCHRDAEDVCEGLSSK
jgi:hypothetical protein